MKRLFAGVVAAAVLVAGCSGGKETKQAEVSRAAVDIDPEALAAFAPLPQEMTSEAHTESPAMIALGRQLFYDDRLSKDGDVSCNSCHDLARYGVDNLQFSLGHNGQEGGRNSPSAYNAAGHIAQFWDGRAADVEEQAKGPVLNPVEMAMTDAEYVEATLRGIPGYVEAFAAAFPGQEQPVTFDNMALAIGAFERGLVTPSRWDAFLAGDTQALSGDEKRGFNAFVSAGCNACHNGAYVGGGMYNKLGLIKEWPGNTDAGRYEVTKNDDDKYFFKVPSLRNVEKTYPYLHDGSRKDLAAVVSMMAEYQLGKTLTDEDVSLIVTYLGSLTGKLPTDYIAAPDLPPSPGGAGGIQ